MIEIKKIKIEESKGTPPKMPNFIIKYQDLAYTLNIDELKELHSKIGNLINAEI